MSYSLAKSIAIAEAVSSTAALGAVWMVGKHPEWIEPEKNSLAEHVIYPCMRRMDKTSTEESLHAKAKETASMLLKGIIMVGTGFATHVPTQMLMDGKADLKEFKQVVGGKSIGLLATLVSLGAIEKMAPHLITKIEDTACQALDASCGPACHPEKENANQEFCKLMVIDLPSSVVSGLVNYCFTKRFAH